MSGSTATTSIRVADPSDRTTTPQVREDIFELRARTAEVRSQAQSLSTRAQSLHDRVQGYDLDDRAAALVQNEPTTLLSLLGEDLGMPWSLVAELIGVSPTAVRKWRKGGSLSPDARGRLARLAAFCQVVPEMDPRVTDVSLWLQTPIIAGSSTLTPGGLFMRGADVQLLNRVANRVSAEHLLDSAVPDWRSTTQPDSRHRVVKAPDGVLAIVPTE